MIRVRVVNTAHPAQVAWAALCRWCSLGWRLCAGFALERPRPPLL